MITFRDMEIEAGRGCNVFDAGDQLRDYVYRLTLEALDEADRVGQPDTEGLGQPDTERLGQPDTERLEQPDTEGLEQPDTDRIERRKEYVRKCFLESIGGLPDSKPPLSPQLSGTVQCEGYHVEKVMFQSSEGVWVSCNLYLPETQGCLHTKYPAVLFVCGHDPEGKQAAEYQRACIILVRAGLAVLAMDSYGQGERSSYYDEACRKERIGRCTREHDYAGFQCVLLGDSAARYLLWDAVRAVDYLASRPDIDESRIGVTGNSGGGTLTMMMMIADKRIAAAAPGTFVTSRRRYLQAGQAQDNEQIWPGLTRLGIDHRDGVLCMAPKPVLLLTAEHDFFPRKGTAETFGWCRRIWHLYGQEENLKLYKDDCMHTYSQGMAQQAALFFRDSFGIRGSAAGDRCGLSLQEKEQGLMGDALNPITILPSPQLWCTGTGYLSREKKSLDIWGQNLARYGKMLENRGHADYNRTISYLEGIIFRNRRPGELFPRKVRETSLVLDLFCDSWIWEPQEGICNHCFLFSMGKEPKPVTIALWRDGCRRVTDHSDWIRRTCRSGRAVLVLDITGIGMVQQREFLSWTDRESFYGARFKLNADLLWLDDCLMALGCFDVLRSLTLAERIPGLEKEDIRLYACGRYSLYGDIAALLDGRIRGVDYESPQESFAEVIEDKYYDPLDIAAFVLPGILKYADIQDIRTWRSNIEMIHRNETRIQTRE